METCHCEQYKKSVENCKIFNVGTLHYLKKRLKPPEGWILTWQGRNSKAVFTESVVDTPKDCESLLMWMPDCPGLISQKLVNENKEIYSPF